MVSFVLVIIAWAFSCKLERECRDRPRSVSETYRPLALARLYGEFHMVQFRYCMYKNNEGDSLAEKYLSVVPNGKKYLSLIRISNILHALKYHL